MSQVVHIVFGSNVRKGLLNTIRALEDDLNQQFHIPSRWIDSSMVLYCPDPLCCGPIFEMDEPMGFYNRLDWIEQFMIQESEEALEEQVYDLTESISDFYKKLAWLSENQTVVIWHAPCPTDQIALRLLTRLLENCDLWEVDLEKNNENQRISQSCFDHFEKEDYVNELSQLTVISSERRVLLSNEWTELRQSESHLRDYFKKTIHSLNDEGAENEVTHLINKIYYKKDSN